MAMQTRDYLNLRKQLASVMGPTKTLGQASLAAAFTTTIMGAMQVASLEQAGLDVEQAAYIAVNGTSMALRFAAVMFLFWCVAKVTVDILDQKLKQ